MNAEISQINDQAGMLQDQTIITKQLAHNFSVSSDRINVLLGNMMRYGDVAAVLAFAEKLPAERNLGERLSQSRQGRKNL